MKACVRHTIPLLVALAAVGLMFDCQATAQTLKVLHDFATGIGYPITNTDGAFPTSPVLLSGDVLYGTTSLGGNSGAGTIFKLNSDGSGFEVLHIFLPIPAANGLSYVTNADGLNPYAGLTMSGNTLYGTAIGGGSAGNGTIFSINSDGTGFTTLHSFSGSSFSSDYGTTNADGLEPWEGLIVSGNTLYGTTPVGGWFGNGTIFKLNTDGTGFTNIHSFTSYENNTASHLNGFYPDGTSLGGSLVLSGDTLYGTANSGGTWDSGTVFKVNTDGSEFTVLYSFSVVPNIGVNNDGAGPAGSLVLSGTNLYGTTSRAGEWSCGTVFAINTDGTGFRTIHAFSGGDGARPQAGLLLYRGTLYGTTSREGPPPAGAWGGTVFKINPDGSRFTTLHSFTDGSDGDEPLAGLISAGNTLYGTTAWDEGSGTIFSLSIPPELTLTPSRPNLVLSWPTNFVGYTLQSATDLNSPVWATNLPSPVVVNGQYTVTNPVSGTQQFFRLSQ
jgi:uncharacterized repeat protein (TIGR03803 family)